MKCLYCNSAFDFFFNEAEKKELLLKDVVEFKKHLSTFAKSCSNCANKDLICLIGRSGSGKSTIANLLMQNEYILVKNTVGGYCLHFTQQGASQVSSSLSSVTTFPVIKQFNQHSMLLDFPGFFDTRSGGLQLLQHILLHELTSSRCLRILVVKDIRVERDLAFVELLNQPWISPSNTLIVFTRVEKHHSVKLANYCEGRVSKKIPVLMMKVAVQGTSFSNFHKRLSKQISYLTPENLPIRLEISAEVFKFQENALKTLFKAIDTELQRIFEKELPKLIIQPYDIPYLRDTLNGQYSLSQVLSLLNESTLSSSQVDTTSLSDLNFQLETLQSLSSSFTIQSLTSWSPSSSSLYINLHNRLNTFIPPTISLPKGDLLNGLNEWHDLVKVHYLQHVSFRARALVLARNASLGNEFAYSELIRLSDYRNQIFERLFEVWKQLESVLMAELEKDDSFIDVDDPSAAFLSTLRMKDAKFVVYEILRFSTENQRDLAITFKVIARKLVGVALADGAIATGAWGARLSGFGSTLPPVSTTAAAIFAATTVAAMSAFAYHLYLTNRQMQKVRAIGFDFSFLKVEVGIWNDVRVAAQRRDHQAVVGCFQSYEREFRLFINSTRQGVIKAKRKLKDARSKGVDVGDWEGLINKVDLMSRHIFKEMKAREHSTPGCYFAEHEWVERSILSFKFPGAKSCCSLFALKPDLECLNCQYLCHSGTCRLNALQSPCKSLIVGQDIAQVPPTKAVPEIKSLAAKESKTWREKDELIQSAALCEMVYNEDISSDDDMIVGQEGEIKYLISFSGEIAFVVIRGTEMLNLSNWITNASALMVEIAPKSKLFVHSGYFSASEKIYDAIWNRIKESGSISEVVFSGRKPIFNLDSLGGAIASLLHLKAIWEKKPVRSKSIGFGSPMLFDDSVAQWLLSKKYNSSFKTFCNQSDLVPGIMQGISDGIQNSLRGNTDISVIASATMGILSREVTKAYRPVGRYIFLEIASFWESSDPELIISRLQQNKSSGENIKYHEMASYREKLQCYLEDKEDVIMIPDVSAD